MMMEIEMRNFHSLLPVLLLALLAGCSTSPSTPTPDGLTPSGSLTIREYQTLRIAVGGSGEGTLVFEGWQYTFSVENMTLSGIGNNPVDLEGTVYNLEKVEDFEGVHKPMKAEFEAGKGLAGLWTKNEKGVVVHIHSTGKDLEMQVHPTGAKVTFK